MFPQYYMLSDVCNMFKHFENYDSYVIVHTTIYDPLANTSIPLMEKFSNNSEAFSSELENLVRRHVSSVLHV